MPEENLTYFKADPQRQQLLKAKLIALLTWQKPELVRTVGPFDPAAFDPFDAERMQLATECVEKLSSYTDQQIARIVEVVGSHRMRFVPEPRDSRTDVGQEWQNLLVAEIAGLIRRIPPWHLGGFGHPDHVADFDYWTKMSSFNLAELTCLTVGIDPAEFNLKKLHDLSTSKDRHQFSRALEYLVRRYELLLREFGSFSAADLVEPEDFIAWSDQVAFEVHPDFLGPLRRLHSGVTPDPAAPTKKQDRREVDSIAQLFTVMAIDYLGYNPKQARSPATKEITELAASMGMSISEDTVLKYLRIGA
jgi:hypothetical protein